MFLFLEVVYLIYLFKINNKYTVVNSNIIGALVTQNITRTRKKIGISGYI